jgi:hypothetical protein
MIKNVISSTILNTLGHKNPSVSWIFQELYLYWCDYQADYVW